MKTCFLFPGQGAQYPGMGRDLWEASKAARAVFDCASDTSGRDVAKLLFEGTEDDLKATDVTQLAVATVDLAAAAALRERGIAPDGCAGFSLGEWAALQVASVVDMETAFRLIAIRGRLMDEAVRSLGETGMSAILFLAPEKTEEILASSGIPDIYVANYNSPIQAVISGTVAALEKAEPLLRDAGAKKIVRLKVSGPFHSPLMKGASESFARAIAGESFADPAIALYSNVTGTRLATGAEAKARCVEQIASPVRWMDEERSVMADSYGRVLEPGPGTVLSGLWKAMTKESACESAGTMERIAALA